MPTIPPVAARVGALAGVGAAVSLTTSDSGLVVVALVWQRAQRLVRAKRREVEARER